VRFHRDLSFRALALGVVAASGLVDIAARCADISTTRSTNGLEWCLYIKPGHARRRRIHSGMQPVPPGRSQTINRMLEASLIEESGERSDPGLNDERRRYTGSRAKVGAPRLQRPSAFRDCYAWRAPSASCRSHWDAHSIHPRAYVAIRIFALVAVPLPGSERWNTSVGTNRDVKQRGVAELGAADVP
jgi:hypothetical protein